MTLHTDYQKLIARGMPEVPRLEVRTDEPYGLWWKRSHHSDCEPIPVPEDDARALITMHALEWFYATVDPEACIDRNANPVRFSVSYMLPGDDSTAYDAYGVTLLDAIIAATKHLEPR